MGALFFLGIMRKIILVFSFFVVGVPLIAQNTNDDFNSFRENMLGNYSQFRKGILTDYADYLAGVWKSFQAFRGIKPDDTPKPKIQPDIPDVKPLQPINIEPESPIKSVPKPDNTNIPQIDNPHSPIIPDIKNIEILYYGCVVQLPDISVQANIDFHKSQSISDFWNALNKTMLSSIVSSLQNYANKYSLNDWTYCSLARKYCDVVFANVPLETRIIATHYLLVHMGFDVRLARTDHQMILLIPTKQIMYNCTYIQIEGKNYYVFFDDINPIKENDKLSIYTCEIPKSVNAGKIQDLTFYRPMKLPLKEKPYNFSYGNISISGTVNTNVIDIYKSYPCMDICYYSQSIPDVESRNEIVSSLKQQVSGMSELQAVNTILHFVQSAFQYKTDGDQFGYEKTFFFEEMLYYPYCDCEDRAIFYSYLLHHVLNLETHLLNYPGHESVAVCLSNKIDGDGYVYNGKTYYISDPTYIGANTGMCMPDFRNIKPSISLAEIQ